MAHTFVQTTNAPSAIGPYSQGVNAGDWLYVSGQLGLLPKAGELISPEFSAQARQALKNLLAIVEAGGFRLDEIVAVDVYLTSMGNFDSFNHLYAEVFDTHRPARAVIEVSGLPKGACIEIKCAACKA